jgi:hypothetical protein
MWRLKDYAEGNDKAENARIIKSSLENLKGRIEQIKYIEVGINVNNSPQAYDAVLYSEFESVEDLKLYQNNPEHKKISEFISKIRNERTVVDYEV